jgi:beta-lactamase superfamily II metal-dependent hydrolase
MKIMIYSIYYICINCSKLVGKKNRYGHPNKEVLDILNNSKVYRTNQDGNIMFMIKNNKK